MTVLKHHNVFPSRGSREAGRFAGYESSMSSKDREYHRDGVLSVGWRLDRTFDGHVDSRLVKFHLQSLVSQEHTLDSSA